MSSVRLGCFYFSAIEQLNLSPCALRFSGHEGKSVCVPAAVLFVFMVLRTPPGHATNHKSLPVVTS